MARPVVVQSIKGMKSEAVVGPHRIRSTRYLGAKDEPVPAGQG